jgi:hypothetical protein
MLAGVGLCWHDMAAPVVRPPGCGHFHARSASLESGGTILAVTCVAVRLCLWIPSEPLEVLADIRRHRCANYLHQVERGTRASTSDSPRDTAPGATHQFLDARLSRRQNDARNAGNRQSLDML